jgi:ABC-type spermidine/putrescine transport system permease subunit I
MRTGLDKYFVDSFVFAIIVTVCCGLIGLVLNIAGLVTCKDPRAKQNATICLILSVVLHAVGLGIKFSGLLNQ